MPPAALRSAAFKPHLSQAAIPRVLAAPPSNSLAIAQHFRGHRHRLTFDSSTSSRGAARRFSLKAAPSNFSFAGTNPESSACVSSAVKPLHAMQAPVSDCETQKIGVLFVCLGNICRSPAAEAVFRSVVQKQGLAHYFHIDSAGTIDYHEGNPADARMKKAAAQRGVDVTSISRPIRPSDFSQFDIILAMDQSNLADIRKAHQEWSRHSKLPPNSLDKVKLMCSFCRKHDATQVPDPYYGGPQGFELVLDLLEDACTELLLTLKPRIPV